jgi:hypothetical protein
MGPAGSVEHPGDENFIQPQACPADRAGSGAIPLKAIRAARDMHEPVIAAQGWKGGGFYPLPRIQAGGADRTGPGRPGETLPMGPFRPPAPGKGGARGGPDAKKQGIPEPQEKNAYEYKNKDL